jgi:pyrrolidone-carboxylate peptidase
MGIEALWLRGRKNVSDGVRDAQGGARDRADGGDDRVDDREGGAVTAVSQASEAAPLRPDLEASGVSAAQGTSSDQQPTTRRDLSSVTGDGGQASAPGKRGIGARTALRGLTAVEKKPKRFQWRAALASALIGLSLVSAQSSTVAQATAPEGSAPSAHTWVMKTGPPLPLAQVQLESRQAAVIAAAQGEEPGQPAPGEEPGAELPRALRMRGEDPVAREQGIAGALSAARATELAPGAPPAWRMAELPPALSLWSTTTSGATVIPGSDPGDFYCEHAFFTATSEAFAAGTSILRNRAGEVLTGFLHTPSDAYTYNASSSPVQAERHADRREIVGAAIRGFFEEARPQLSSPGAQADFRVLLTGYGTWGSVVNNPTGDFVVHQENVDAALKHAFGDALADASGKVLQRSADGERTTLAYRVLDEASGHSRTIVVDAVRLPVTDAAIDGSGGSLQDLIRTGRPHAVLSMGVAGGSSAYQAEFHADDGGLALTADGRLVHDDKKKPENSHPDNHSLGRAIHLGQKLIDARAASPGRV